MSAAGLGRSVGFALKVHQRAWALQHDATEIAWTYDPLIRRNAYFNLVKLGAWPAEYLPNFYGGMHDQINGGGDTDRVLVTLGPARPPRRRGLRGHDQPGQRAGAARGRGLRWRWRSTPTGTRPCPPAGPGIAGTGCRPGAGARPVPSRLTSSGCGPATPAPPRPGGPRSATRWAQLMAAGGRVTGFDRAGWYVIEGGSR